MMFQLVEISGANLFLLQDLASEATCNGYHFVQRTIAEWNSGLNQFSGPGEVLWVLQSGADVIGMGGLNRDPYLDDAHIGRVRHLYIREAYRRQGYASFLMRHILFRARAHFTALRLFTDNPDAAEFYEGMGFARVEGERVSHEVGLLF